MIRKYRVVQLGMEDGDFFEENQQYPHIVPYVGSDDSKLFVVDKEDPQQFWPADEFFLMECVNEFTAEIIK